MLFNYSPWLQPARLLPRAARRRGDGGAISGGAGAGRQAENATATTTTTTTTNNNNDDNDNHDNTDTDDNNNHDVNKLRTTKSSSRPARWSADNSGQVPLPVGGAQFQSFIEVCFYAGGKCSPRFQLSHPLRAVQQAGAEGSGLGKEPELPTSSLSASARKSRRAVKPCAAQRPSPWNPEPCVHESCPRARNTILLLFYLYCYC